MDELTTSKINILLVSTGIRTLSLPHPPTHTDRIVAADNAVVGIGLNLLECLSSFRFMCYITMANLIVISVPLYLSFITLGKRPCSWLLLHRLLVAVVTLGRWCDL